MRELATPDSLRYELKLVCQEEAYEEVRSAFVVHPAGVRRHHPPRRVQSVYLDTPFGRALEENRAGISHREKIRFRWYGDEHARVTGTLERKVRENQLGWKETLHLLEPVVLEGADRRGFVRRLAELATEPWRAALRSGLEPVQWIRYRREYLVTMDQRVRITLDRGLEAFDQRLSTRLTTRRRTFLPRLCVVELKARPHDLDAARALLSDVPLMVDRCSKFVLASDPAHGPHPSFFR